MAVKSYALWNNKGGVGKSTITFHLAARYAELFPDQNVLVVDMCPQSNASMMLLGGGARGENQVLELCTMTTPKTVVGYMSTVLSGGQRAPLPDPGDFVFQVASKNTNMPKNLFLLCGDGNLEPMAPLISEQARAASLIQGSDPWRWVHELVRIFIGDASKRAGGDWLVLVDTNPSFGIYTEIAISGVDRLIVPVNADDSSRVATSAMFTLIHGTTQPHPIYGAYTYATKAGQAGLTRPLVHLMIGNRLTQNVGPAAAFKAISDATAEVMYESFQKFPNRFTTRSTAIASVDDFRTSFSIPLRDFNTAGVVASHLGVSLANLPAGRYDVYGQSVQINRERVKECFDAVTDVVHRL